ncbi:hypothetical protein [Streptomyces sp. NPDC088739]|uniref:hypothetical protein n=1 Tax=Streptomyces sp. NPDC088739 TaxID=3365882 RepID=UPI0037F73C09
MTQTPKLAMIEAADAVETFTHRSFGEGPDWKTPPHTYAALGPMVRLARNLVQAVDQVTFPVDRTQAEGRVALDDDSGPVGRIARMKQAQRQAAAAANALVQALAEMHAATSAMGYDTLGLPEDDEEDTA